MHKSYDHQGNVFRAACRTARTAMLLAGVGLSTAFAVNLPGAAHAQAHAAVGTSPVKSARAMRGVELASLGESTARGGYARRSLSGGGVRWSASAGCLNSTLRQVIAEVSARFGAVTVNSTCRSHGRNAQVGGAPRSHHLTGNAVDFSVGGNRRMVHAFLSGHRSVGGLKLYDGGHFHIDTGARRTW